MQHTKFSDMLILSVVYSCCTSLLALGTIMVWKFPGSEKSVSIFSSENCLESMAVKIKPLQTLVKFCNCRHSPQPVTILI